MVLFACDLELKSLQLSLDGVPLPIPLAMLDQNH